MSFLKALIIHPQREVSTKLREYLANEKRIKILGEAITS
ncbi:MAG: DNA-binding response regulator, partial [Desulfonatronovibrio sp. MSAO_Bac4]